MKTTLVLIIVVLEVVSTRGEFAASFEPKDAIIVVEEETEYLEMTLTDVDVNMWIEVRSSSPDIFTTNSSEVISFKIPYEFGHNATGYSFLISVTGVKLGIADILFTARDNAGRVLEGYEILPYTVKVNRKPSIIDTIYRYTLQVWLILSYTAMGVKMDWKVIRRRLRRPWAILIGVLCQFIIMPLLAYSIAKLLQLDDTAAIGLITVGSSPGGWVSNVFSLLLDLDLVLSLTMTFCSTVLALGFMPLNAYIYSAEFINGNEALKTPFLQIILQLVILIVPVLAGMVILYKWPKVARILKILVKPFVIGMVITSAVVGVPANIYVLFSPTDVFMSAMVFPFVGGILGLLFSKLACLCNKSALTVAFETGAQNSLLATTVIYMSYPNPEADLIRRLPFLVAMMTIFESSIITIIVKIMKRFPGRPYEDETEDAEDISVKVDKNNGTDCRKDSQTLEETSASEGSHHETSESSKPTQTGGSFTNTAFDSKFTEL
ncbi:ileal sodium/bile acid cotransporter-like isoform X2 [Anneissia japonica]|nr:ileal sodium/bile acid cotransporter-like isoform X2 [Anneissia japonica]XP_033117275.1 ileal sodium/bile acid cotransporter-like isoform X2 [Anneissia japonica]XP_033117276.1 ileal sodium/bile acid cotransporter-like isoform X2 [Anneissia japonica]